MLHLKLDYRRGDFHLELELTSEHRITALSGDSGSGKTTLLDLIAGLKTPRAGRIEVDGTLLFDSSQGLDIPVEDRRVGYLFQDGKLFPHLSVKDNLLYGRKRRQYEGPALEEVVSVLELGNMLERSPNRLSGGEKQRVALGRALLSAPRILLLDEPLANLDEGAKTRILDYLDRTLRHFQLPALFVSHSSREIRDLADWLILIGKGNVLRQGLPAGMLAGADS
ncbi:MAG: ATP-binding cassette domain-containing protein [Candidatus Krumholzibacteria bacterium]|jgi:molybdate transport system ATP-binding protein|nr:ATP-binding cassette domain-containing protein [Candidatus Krumholzibacteria bacterium]MDP6669836.1 ATP-binding cassette domain-containing protein [Candidatus Krumholzibacteria bacterium]MDP6797741.1 ATP-binding cassette domain-containing protein [Candidatus Krumholzibacteria bacterium]MDP7022235.1 ATP-binding cassette domain-containing protein [Candidatus Krumholzibacteria bacterium]